MIETDDEECRSPISCVNSVFDFIDQACSSPATSVAYSPYKLRDTRLEDTASAQGLDGFHDAEDTDNQPGDSRGYDTDEASRLNITIPPLELFVSQEQQHGEHHPTSNATSISSHMRRRTPFGLHSPDRFIPARSATPSKQALHLSRSGSRAPSPLAVIRPDNGGNPFLPPVRRRAIISERYAVLRSPPRPPRDTGFALSSVNTTRAPHRQGSGPANLTWTTNGVAVTEGVLSTTNSRGGRVTSGSNAPHFCADLLRLTEADQGLETHQRRLAMAMEIEQSTRIINLSQQKKIISVTPESTIWRDSRWSWGQLSQEPSRSTSPEKICHIPFRVLDAPTLRDDYYCSLLAYCPILDCLAVGLANHIYLWSEKGRRSDGLPESLVSHHNPNHVTSISFSSSSKARSILAIGRSDGLLNLWHPLEKQPRFSKRHAAPLAIVSFRPFTTRRLSVRDGQTMVDTEELLVGDDLGQVLLYSIEWPSQTECNLFDWDGSLMLRAVITCHSQQICGLAWSIDGEQFATGANDNRLSVFAFSEINKQIRAAEPSLMSQSTTQRLLERVVKPECSFVTYGDEKRSFSLNAAVKAIAFAPWQSDLLVAGGGSNDRCVHFFHIRSGARLATINCHAQVTSVIWNTQRKELAVTLGFAQPKHSFRVVVFAWPSCALLTSIPWVGEERALFAVAFPGGPSGRRDPRRQTLVIATSDASIKFHEVWPRRKVKNRRFANGVESQILGDTCSIEMLEEATIR